MADAPAAGRVALPLPLPRAAAAGGGAPALIWGRQVFGYQALAQMAAADARRLSRWLGPGDRVALVMDASPRLVALFHAAGYLQAVVAPVVLGLGRGELATALEVVSPALVVADPGTWTAAVEAAPAGTPVVVAVADAGAPEIPVPSGSPSGGLGPGPAEGAPPPGAVLDELPSADVALASEAAAPAPLAIVVTSGTSGRPKGVVLSHGNFAASARASARRLGHDPDDRWLAAMPVGHIGGLAILWRCATAATTVVLHRRFRAAAVADSLVRDRVTMMSLVPTMLGRLLATGAPAPPWLRVVLVGGAAATPRLMTDALAAGYPVAPTYGLTEAASQVATAAPGEMAPGDPVAARPLDGTQVRIAGDEGRRGGSGEILVRGPTVMSGYWRDAEATGRALAGGWLHTGDVGRLDDSGRLHVLGRVDDMIKTGGEKVAPTEVEAAIATHPQVENCAVVGIPSPEWGTAVAAAVVARPAGEVSAVDLAGYLRRRLAPHKVPKVIVWLPALPVGPSGKVDRAAVVRLLAHGPR